jgi:MinD-like ATPase involved in chromosome partitioning or flagellar assembly
VATIVSVHSFRGGTGKSNTTANLAACLAASGRRVGVIDADIQSPGIHVLFGLSGDDVGASLNDFLWHGRAIGEVAQDVTERQGVPLAGRLFLIPSSMQPGEIARVLREGYDAQRLTEGLRDLVAELGLDVLFIDTHPGLNEETLLSIAISDTLLILLRPDQQDYQGTSVTVEIARKLDVPSLMLIVNKVPEVFDAADVRTRVEETYNAPVAAVLPHSNEMMALGSNAIFVLRHPDNPITTALTQVARALVG